ncbi:MFS transporter, partial [Streptomyces sp. 2MCAF27]
VGGYLSDRDQRLSVALPAALLTATLLAMFAVGTNPLVAVGALVLTGSAMGALTPALQNRVMEFAPGGTDTASAGNSIAYNVGIAVGSSLGGLTMTHFGPRSIALAGAALAAAATLIALWPSAPGHPGTARTKEEARG